MERQVPIGDSRVDYCNSAIGFGRKIYSTYQGYVDFLQRFSPDTFYIYLNVQYFKVLATAFPTKILEDSTYMGEKMYVN